MSDIGTKPAERVLHDLHNRNLLDLVEAIRLRRGVALLDLCGRERSRSVSWARHEVWWALRHDPDRHFSLLEIARLFGRDHATVKAGIDAHVRRAAVADTKP